MRISGDYPRTGSARSSDSPCASAIAPLSCSYLRGRARRGVQQFTAEHGRRPCGYSLSMTSVLTYVLAVLLVPLAVSLMLFVMARIEGDSRSGQQAELPQVR